MDSGENCQKACGEHRHPLKNRMKSSYEMVAENLARRLHSMSHAGTTPVKSGDGTMRYFDEQDRRAASNGLSRFGRWLGSRKFESWGFFIAGFILARIIF
jgi:hypothetical protein